MDEQLWRNCRDPHALLALLYPQRSHGSVWHQTRQSRMYLVACARQMWDRLPVVCRTLVSLAEACADAPRQKEPLRSAIAPIAEKLMNSFGEEQDLLEAEAELIALGSSGCKEPALARPREAPPAEPVPPLGDDEWKGLARLVYLPFESKTPRYEWVPAELHSVSLLREVYGRPYAFAPFLADWRTDNVMHLASDMFERREFSAMPILADMLGDAGCEDHEILDHCRHGNWHVRGCWVLDHILRDVTGGAPEAQGVALS